MVQLPVQCFHKISTHHAAGLKPDLLPVEGFVGVAVTVSLKDQMLK
jgi:hypothetical protein